jgi:hypothetical protein
LDRPSFSLLVIINNQIVAEILFFICLFISMQGGWPRLLLLLRSCTKNFLVDFCSDFSF